MSAWMLSTPEREEQYRRANGYEMTYTDCRKAGHSPDDWGDCPRCGAVPGMDDRVAELIESGEFQQQGDES